jgi:hypothetical protein
VPERGLEGFKSILNNIKERGVPHLAINCSKYFYLLPLLNNISKFSCTSLYFANPKKMITRLMAKFILHQNLITFDDGFGNVSGAGYFYQNDSGIKKIVIKYLGFKSYVKFLNEIKEHYSIYPNLENVFSVTDYFKLDYDLYKVKEIKAKFGVAFIGSPLSEYRILQREDEVQKVTELLSRFSGSVVYLKHPAEDMSKIEEIKNLNNDLIITALDDIAENFLIANVNKIDFVVGFYSTVLLHVSGYYTDRVYAKKISSQAFEKIYEKLKLAGIIVF